MKIQKQTSYLAPEGEYSGIITSGRLLQDTRNGRLRESVRLTIAIDPIPHDPLYKYLARVDYYDTQANQFIADAKTVLGSDQTPLTNIQGEILADRLSLLEGKRVRFTVTHARRPGHETPYRKVENLRPDQKNP